MNCRKCRCDPNFRFAQALRREARGNAHEQTELRRLAPRVSWEEIVAAIEKVKGQKWDEFCQRHGDWGRDAALWLGRRRARLTLAQLGELAGGVDYAAVSQAVSRFGKRLANERYLRRTIIARLENELSKV